MVAIDIRRLRSAELCRLLNSTPLGTVIGERQLYRHRIQAGFRLGDGQHIDLFRYAAWLVELRHTPKSPPTTDHYEDLKNRSRARNVAIALAGRDIGPLPAPLDPARRLRAKSDFRFFCESYFPLTFHLPWSKDHLKVIAKIEEAVLKGGLFAMAMPRGSGKALALDTPLPTPFGWTTMGNVQIGDLLFDDEGSPCRVTHATEVQFSRPCYRVRFSDGESIVCDADHLWTVDDRWSRQNPLTLRTEQMRDRVVLPQNRAQPERRYRVRMPQPIRTPEVSLEIDPYVLGYWLGDGARGNNTITVHVDDVGEVAAEITRCGESCKVRSCVGNVAICVVGRGHKADPAKTRHIRTAQAALACHVPVSQAAAWSGLTKKSVAAIRSLGRWESIRQGRRSSLWVRLKHLGLVGNKHIPTIYLRAAPWQRLALLQGLMDTDGSVNPKGQCEITLKDDQLGHDLGELLSSLGFRWGCTTRYVEREGCVFGPYLRYYFSAFREFPVFRLRRKLNRLKPRLPKGCWAGYRQIVSIESVPSVPVRCVQVDSPNHLYLAGRKMVPTHNTTVSETACLWATLYGHRDFVCLIGSDEGHAMDMLESIKTELDGNDLLAEDFPDVCFPIECLDGIANRCNGQLYQEERTHIGWTAKDIVLPTLQPAGWFDNPALQPFVDKKGFSLASGAILKVAGITGRIRGMKFKRADGRSARPSLVVIDDPQTDESSRSLSQCATRESILAGAVLGLAGPGKKISGIMPCTVIRPGDMADNILDRDKHPEWNGERTKMVYAFPTNERLWLRYSEIRAESLRMGHGGREATEFYRENREAMDEGAQVAWPERHNYDELSAIQHAMNLKLQDEAAFFAEYQNEPLPEEVDEDDLLSADQIAAKTNRLARGTVPIGCNHLTMFVDIQAKLLFYVIAAWEDDFSGYVVDYGSYPDQKRSYFTLRDARHTLGTAAPGTGLEGSIYAGLEALTGRQLSKKLRRDDGAEMQIERCLIDANWGVSTDVVYQFCRQSAHSAILLPSHGRFVGASSVPFSEYKRKLGDRVGHNWRIPNVQGKRAVRHVVFDANYWKTFCHARLAVAMGDKGCLSLFGDNSVQHRLFAEHITAEYRVKTAGRGRTVDEWKLRPEATENHWLDCLVGCAVAASIQGVVLFGAGQAVAPKRPRLKLSDLQRNVRVGTEPTAASVAPIKRSTMQRVRR